MGSIDTISLIFGLLAAMFFIDRSVKSRTDDYRKFIKYLETKLDKCNEFSKFCLMLGEDVGANGDAHVELGTATKAYEYRSKLAEHFSVDEMRVIAYDLYGEKSSDIYGDNKDVYSMHLLSYATRTLTTEILISRCKQERPQVVWK